MTDILTGSEVEWADGSKGWLLNGKFHREDGPAVEWADGTKQWFLNGKQHRIDGPAIECSDGIKHWFLNGIQLPSEEVAQWIEENMVDLNTDEGQMAYKLRWI